MLERLVSDIIEARRRSMDLVADLTDEQLRVKPIAIVNPLDWELGHVAYFQELFALRQVDGRTSVRDDADALFDSAAIAHDVRWDLPLPSREDLWAYLHRVRDEAVAAVERGDLSTDARYRHILSVAHEDMHGEAFTYTRQTMGYPAPRLSLERVQPTDEGPLEGDAAIGGGTFMFGSAPGAPFVLDNEQWAHPREVAPYRIARAAVSQGDFAAFVDDDGYVRQELWSEGGWRWRRQERASAPLYWRRRDGWERRDFDRWVPLEPHRAMVHVNWFEAEAYCEWADRRLPTELEWEVAASATPDGAGRIVTSHKRRYPWGDAAPTPDRANLDARAMGCVDVGALPAGDSAFGCRQMLGNTWEWCADTFGPHPGFAPGPYAEYSEPLFGSTKVLRGGAWPTRARLVHNMWRNYYEPHRRDVWAGFRTCAKT